MFFSKKIEFEDEVAVVQAVNNTAATIESLLRTISVFNGSLQGKPEDYKATHEQAMAQLANGLPKARALLDKVDTDPSMRGEVKFHTSWGG